MPSTYTGNLGIELPADGELDGVWGDVVNDNMNIIDRAINGSLALALSGTSSTLTTSDGSLSDGQYKLLVLGGTPSGTHTITIAPSNAQKIYFVRNTTAQSVVFTQGSGGNVTVATGDSAIIYSDGAGAGAAVVNITNDFAMNSVKITGGTIDGTVIGGTSAAAGTFTTANATTVDTTNIEVTTLKAKDGTSAGSIADSTGVVTLASSVLTTTDINGGTIDGTVIGGSSAAAGTFTTVAASGVASFADGTAALPSITNTGDTNTGILFPAADTVAVSTAGTERVRIDSSGNVGIGTTSPTEKLQVGTTASNYIAIAKDGVTSSGIKIIRAGTLDGLIEVDDLERLNIGIDQSGTLGTGVIRFLVGSTERVRIDTAGNVGIGTTAPAYALEAAGVTRAIAATGTGNPQFLAITSDAAGIPFVTLQNATASWQNRNNGTTGDLSWSVSGTERMRITIGGNLIVGNGDTSATPTSSTLRTTNGSGTDIAGAALTIQGGRGTGTGAGGALLFSTASAGTTGSSLNAATERMRINSSGNVGIGTSSPSVPLQVAGSITFGSGSVSGDYTLTLQSGTGDSTFFRRYTTGLAEIRQYGGSFQLVTQGANPIIFNTNATERMRIDASGNVGIGTTSPINNGGYGGLSLNGTTGSIFSLMANGTETGRLGAVSGETFLQSMGSGVLKFIRGAGGTESMRIDSSGNVGIGTTSPSASLDVLTQVTGALGISLRGRSSDNVSDFSLKSNDAATVYGQIQGRSTDLRISGVGSLPVTVYTGSTSAERMRIDASGNVGIGTSSPGRTLSVTGTLGLDTTGIGLVNSENAFRTTTSPEIYSTSTGGSGIFSEAGHLVLQPRSSGALRAIVFAAGNPAAERMRIDASGNVGIGVTPRAWEAGTAIQMAGGQGYSKYGVTNNAYYDGAAYRYISTATATLYGNSGGSHLWFNAPSGTAGNAITFTQAMTLDASGRLLVGATSNITNGNIQTYTPSGGANVDIYAAGVGAVAKVRLYNDTDQGAIGYAGNNLIFYNSSVNTERARIDASGNLGIGNTAPVTKLHVTGASITTGVTYLAQPAQTSKAAAATLTIAELLTGIVQYTGAVATLTLPTGTSIEGGLPATFPTDMSFDVSFINTGAGLLTIGANGNTTVGTMTVATLTSAMLRFRKTATNTYTVYRIS